MPSFEGFLWMIFMAIQLPDVGTGVPADKTGDSPWLAMKKVRENFNDQTNAASRLVGTASGQVPEVKDINSIALKSTSGASTIVDNSSITSLAQIPAGGSHFIGSSEKYSDAPTTPFTHANYIRFDGANNSGLDILHGYAGNTPFLLYMRNSRSAVGWMKIYHDRNTTKDSNGFIKAASPIVKVFANKAELNSDAENQNVTYKKNGVGDYTITTVSGLSTDGWYIELPKDMNGNPKVAVTLSEEDGVISLKTYKRIFSMETFTFEPDLEQPLDIPDGRWIDLRLNEIPVEAQEDLPTDGG